MSLGSWDPSTGSNDSTYKIDIEFLQSIIQWVKGDNWEDIENFLTLEQQQKHQAIMLLPKSEWFSIEDKLLNDDIISLIQFFTLAEMKYNEWSAEEKSPVIWLNKLLRKKGSALDKELLLWIKSQSTNKFIPHGAL